MTAYDAMFLAAAAGMFSKRPQQWYWAAVAPLVAYAVGQLPVGEFHIPLAALLVCVAAPRFVAPALFLVVPSYSSVFDATLIACVWLGLIMALSELANRRLDDESVPELVRGAPASFFALAVLYYALYPIMYL